MSTWSNESSDGATKAGLPKSAKRKSSAAAKVQQSSDHLKNIKISLI